MNRIDLLADYYLFSPENFNTENTEEVEGARQFLKEFEDITTISPFEFKAFCALIKEEFQEDDYEHFVANCGLENLKTFRDKVKESWDNISEWLNKI